MTSTYVTLLTSLCFLLVVLGLRCSVVVPPTICHHRTAPNPVPKPRKQQTNKQTQLMYHMMRSLPLFFSLTATIAFPLAPPPLRQAVGYTRLHDTIVSPFDNTDRSGSGDEPVATLPDMSDKGPLDLTWENVELVLDDMRPYLIQDGGNVAITDIDGPVVRLELQGACGTCPSSTVS